MQGSAHSVLLSFVKLRVQNFIGYINSPWAQHWVGSNVSGGPVAPPQFPLPYTSALAEGPSRSGGPLEIIYYRSIFLYYFLPSEARVETTGPQVRPDHGPEL